MRALHGWDAGFACSTGWQRECAASGYVTMVQQRLLTSTGLCFSVSCSCVNFLLAVLGNNPDSTIIQQLLDGCSR